MSLLRRVLLAGSENVWLREHAMRWRFVRRAVSAFMPGERVDEALDAAQALQAHGIAAILTRLGEAHAGANDAQEVADHYLHVMDQVAARGLDAQISVKPTQLGYDKDPERCLRHLLRLLDHAERHRTIVWIDMERSAYVEGTLGLFRSARARSARVGVALQAYLYRTAADVEALLPLGCHIRLVKGAYFEAPAVAYPRKRDVDANYLALARRLLAPDAVAAGTVLHLATHDRALVARLRALIRERGVPSSQYAFAMLYGIQRAGQRALAAEGEPTRVLISYGEAWFPWYMRRLAERPANVWFVVKQLFSLFP